MDGSFNVQGHKSSIETLITINTLDFGFEEGILKFFRISNSKGKQKRGPKAAELSKQYLR